MSRESFAPAQLYEAGTAAQARAVLTEAANRLSFFMIVSRFDDKKINKLARSSFPEPRGCVVLIAYDASSLSNNSCGSWHPETAILERQGDFAEVQEGRHAYALVAKGIFTLAEEIIAAPATSLGGLRAKVYTAPNFSSRKRQSITLYGRAIQQRIRSGERSPEEMLTIFWS